MEAGRWTPQQSPFLQSRWIAEALLMHEIDAKAQFGEGRDKHRKRDWMAEHGSRRSIPKQMVIAGMAEACIHSRVAGKAYRDVRLFMMVVEALSQALEGEFGVCNTYKCAIWIYVDLGRRRIVITASACSCNPLSREVVVTSADAFVEGKIGRRGRGRDSSKLIPVQQRC